MGIRILSITVLFGLLAGSVFSYQLSAKTSKDIVAEFNRKVDSMVANRRLIQDGIEEVERLVRQIEIRLYKRLRSSNSKLY